VIVEKWKIDTIGRPKPMTAIIIVEFCVVSREYQLSEILVSTRKELKR